MNVEPLSEGECRRLLEQATIGRLGLIVDSDPEVLPVNYALDNGTIVFRTSRDGPLFGATRQARVAFEIDFMNPVLREGWSVLVVGPAREEQDAAEVRRLHGLQLGSWGRGDLARWVRIELQRVTGRRVAAAP